MGAAHAKAGCYYVEMLAETIEYAMTLISVEREREQMILRSEEGLR